MRKLREPKPMVGALDAEYGGARGGGKLPFEEHPEQPAQAALPLCDACAAPSSKRTAFEAATNGRTIMLCRDCTRITVRVQRNLEASRRLVGIRGTR